jgi:hypothetical protein
MDVAQDCDASSKDAWGDPALMLQVNTSKAQLQQ